MKKSQVVWKGKKAEGMRYRTKQKLLLRVSFLIFLHDFAVYELGEEEIERLGREGTQIRKRGGTQKLLKNVKLYRHLPLEILEKIENMQAFCLGYFSADVRAMLESYRQEHLLR